MTESSGVPKGQYSWIRYNNKFNEKKRDQIGGRACCCLINSNENRRREACEILSKVRGVISRDEVDRDDGRKRSPLINDYRSAGINRSREREVRLEGEDFKSLGEDVFSLSSAKANGRKFLLTCFLVFLRSAVLMIKA